MFIYNVTVHIAWPSHDRWLAWMKEKHLPEIMHTGCFTRYQFVRLLEADETDGPTYAIQFYAESKAQYNYYQSRFAADLKKEALGLWGADYHAFRSLMQVVD
jgi:hypothetical protein